MGLVRDEKEVIHNFKAMPNILFNRNPEAAKEVEVDVELIEAALKIDKKLISVLKEADSLVGRQYNDLAQAVIHLNQIFARLKPNSNLGGGFFHRDFAEIRDAEMRMLKVKQDIEAAIALLE